MAALSDLRAARWLIDRRARDLAQTVDEMEAVRNIDGAINEIKKAAIDDGKDNNDHAGVDEIADRGGRFNKALELLRRANEDINKEEDNAFAQGLRNRATGMINNAIGATEKAKRQ
jgi:tetratricopeptide (TPR) repeat protein